MKIHYNKDVFKGPDGGMTESIFTMPFEDPSIWPQEPLQNNRFRNVIGVDFSNLEYTSLEECDFVVIPYKFDNSQVTRDLIEEANDKGKKVIAIYNDDDQKPLPLTEEEGIVFRTSYLKSQKSANEYPFPAFVGDFYEQSHIIREDDQKNTIGFCGQAFVKERRKSIQKLRKNQNFKTDFILRSGFWAPELPKEQARREFLDNMINNLFMVCARGEGNFSYRLYETLMMGRIPIIIDSDQELPFESIIDYNRVGPIIPFEDISNINKALDSWFQKNYPMLEDIQVFNRQIWERYMSPEGWLMNFEKEIA